MMPLISYIVAIYNTEKYLKRCIDSLLAQTYNNIEILLVNDGSTDGSRNICDEYAGMDSRIQVLNKTNGGLSDARNHGMRFAKGDYVIFVDSDDWCSPLQAQMLENAIKSSESDIFVYGYYNDFSNEKITKEFSLDAFLEKNGIRVYSGKEIRVAIFQLEQSGIFNTVWNKMYRRNFLIENHFEFELDGMPGEDLLFNTGCFKSASGVCLCNCMLYHYMVQDEVTLSRKYMSDLYERNMKFCKARDSLYDFYDMDSYEENICRARAYVHYCFGCIPNNFRKNAPKGFQKRKRIFVKLFQNEKLEQQLRLVKGDSRQYRVLFLFCRIKSATLAYIIYGAVMFLRNNYGEIYKTFRKKLYRKNNGYIPSE